MAFPVGLFSIAMWPDSVDKSPGEVLLEEWHERGLWIYVRLFMHDASTMRYDTLPICFCGMLSNQLSRSPGLRP